MPLDDIIELVEQIVAFLMRHNAEPEDVDLLMEVEDLDLLVSHVDKTNVKRTCNYLTSSARYLPEPDGALVLEIAFMIYMKFKEYPSALMIALFLDKKGYVMNVFTSCDDLLWKKQFCYILARHGCNFELDDDMVYEDEDRFLLQDIINNAKLTDFSEIMLIILHIVKLEREVVELRQSLNYKTEKEVAVMKVLKPVEQEQKVADDSRISVEQEAIKQKHALCALQENYDNTMSLLAEIEKKVKVAESMLEATLQYESSQAKVVSSPRLLEYLF